jgi:O-succinylhomoserine sulfhydrylase
MSEDWHEHGLATRAVRVGQYQDVSDQHSEALVLTSSYVFDDAQDAAEKFAGRRPGNVYIRFHNPTTSAFEERLAALEGGDAAVATGSGMAAYMALAFALLEAGDHVVLAEGVFGTTTNLFHVYLKKFGISTSSASVVDTDRWQSLIRPNTKMFVLESPTNPMMSAADIRALAAIAAEHDILLVVDNTLCTPIYQNPLDLGADLVLHSAGKYLDGQGRCGGGAVVGGEELIAKVRGVLRTVGPSLSPFNAWIFLKSLETLPLRMREHSRISVALSTWLAEHPLVERVYFTGSPDHPQADLIAKQQTGHGGLMSFTIRGGQREAWRVIDSLKLISNTTNIGDTKSMATHPATTTHGRLSDAQKEAAGITGNLIRLSVGFEDVSDLIADLDTALRSGVSGTGEG